jgi:hypothetical protein
MSSNLKTALVAGGIALAVTIFAVGSAQAGGRHHIPFGPIHGYVPSSYGDDDYDTDSYGCDECGYGDTGDAEDAVAATAARAARRYLGVNVGDVIGEIAE